MKCKEIIEKLNQRWPENMALEWDNVGLLVGDDRQEVTHIFVALDVTDETLSQAISCGADMMVTHHPMLFSPQKMVVSSDFIGRRIIGLIKNGISCYAMHTNFDVAGMADLNAASLEIMSPSVLDVTCLDDRGQEQGIGRVGLLSRPVTLLDFTAFVKEKLELPGVLMYGDGSSMVQKAAVSSGSGKSMIRAAIRAGADVLVTGDIDYHTGIDANAQGLMLVDAGHYGTEMIFIRYMERELKKMFPKLSVTGAAQKQPFRIV